MNILMPSSEYSSMFHSEESMWWYKGIRNLIARYLSVLTKENLKILDIGCGTGKTAEFLTSTKYSVYGIDISKEALVYCKKRKLKNIFYGSIQSIPFPDNFFDVIICFDVLGSLEVKSTHKAVLEVYRVLKRDGLLLVHAAAFEWLRSPHDEKIHWQKRYTLKELKSLFPVTLWKLSKISYRVFFLFFPVLCIKLGKKILKPFFSTAHSDQYIPPKVINYFLTQIQIIENIFLYYINFPFGSSIFLVAQKKLNHGLILHTNEYPF